jgi:hypothetical protein
MPPIPYKNRVDADRRFDSCSAGDDAGIMIGGLKLEGCTTEQRALKVVATAEFAGGADAS